MNNINNTIARSESKQTRPITSMLLKLGKTLPKDPKNSQWMDVEEICAICKERGIQLNGAFPIPKDLEPALRDLFENTDEICTDGINITGFLKRVKWDLVFVLRFFPDVHPGNIETVAVKEKEKVQAE